MVISSLAIINSYSININDPNYAKFLFINGFWQGIVFINLGVISYNITMFIKNKNLEYKNLFSIIQVILLLLMIVNTFYGFGGNIFTALSFMLLVILSFSVDTNINALFKSDIWQKFELIGFIMYLNNCSIRTFMLSNISGGYVKLLGIFLVINIIVSVTFYFIIEYIFPRLKGILNRRDKYGNKKRLQRC